MVLFTRVFGEPNKNITATGTVEQWAFRFGNKHDREPYRY